MTNVSATGAVSAIGLQARVARPPAIDVSHRRFDLAGADQEVVLDALTAAARDELPSEDSRWQLDLTADAAWLARLRRFFQEPESLDELEAGV